MLPHPQPRQYQDRERFAETARIDLSYLALPVLAFRLLPYGLSVTSRSIGQSLANCALNRTGGALHVIYALPDAIAIPEIELAQVAVQVLLGAMLVDALHAALEDRIVALNSVGGDSGGFDDGVAIRAFLVGDFVPVADVLLFAVVHSVVAGKVLADFGINVGFVRHETTFALDILADDRGDLRNGRAVNMEATGRTAALDESEDGVLVGAARTAPTLGLAFQATDIGFVYLDHFAFAAHRGHTSGPHSLTDAMAHEPSGLEGNAQGAGKLVAGNALLAGAKQVHRLKPQVHRDVAVLENGADFDGELFAALVALPKPDPGRFAAHLADPVGTPTMRANRPFRPNSGFNPSDSGGFGLHDFGGKYRLGHNDDFPYLKQWYRRHMGL